jgi:hypothetical protein
MPEDRGLPGVCVTCIHQNVCSLLNKIDRIEILLVEQKPSLLMLTEHALNDQEAKSIAIADYRHVSSFCRKGYKGGGVLILAKDECEFSEVSIGDNICQDKHFEAAVCRLDSRTCAVTYFVGVYRSPNGCFATFIDRFNSLLDHLYVHNPTIVIMGDLNVDSLQYSVNLSNLIDLLTSYGLNLAYCGPTRVQGTTEKAIDHVITNISESDFSASVFNHAISDHYGQMLSLNKYKELVEAKMFSRNMSQNCLKNLSNRLINESWYDVINDNNSVEVVTSVFIQKVQKHLDEACPLKYKKIAPTTRRPNWLTPGLIVSGKRLKELHYISRTMRNEASEEYYSNYKRIYNKLIRLAKRGVITKKISTAKNSSSEMWRIINSVRNGKISRKSIPKLNTESGTLNEPREMAEFLNDRFVNIRDKLDLPSAIAPVSSVQLMDSFEFIPLVTEEKVVRILKALKPSSSAGLDNIPAIAVKYCASVLGRPLAYILNRSFSSGEFPRVLKLARVTPIHKGGERSDPDNYRPISILPAISKVLERHVHTVLYEYLEKNKLIADSQFGFRKNRSTTKALIDYFEHIIDGLENGRHVLGTFLDMSKAFDCVDTEVLLGIMADYGITGSALTWFRTYLLERYQVVQIRAPVKGHIKLFQSEEKMLVGGVPQGSILGPLLFLLYVNGLSKIGSFRTIQFADDTSLVCVAESAESVEMDNFIAANGLSQHITHLGLKVNESKTVLMNFSLVGRNAAASSLLLNTVVLNESNSAKLLGMTVDSKLSWALHVERLCGELSSAIFLLRRLSTYCDASTLRVAYFSTVHAKLCYGIALWGGCSAANMTKVLRVQKRAVRCIAGLKNRQSCRAAFKSLGILTAPALYIFETIRHVMGGDILAERTEHAYCTRASAAVSLALPRVRLGLTVRKPSYIGKRFFNMLPNDLRVKIVERPKFMLCLKTFLVNKVLYTVDEFMNEPL